MSKQSTKKISSGGKTEAFSSLATCLGIKMGKLYSFTPEEIKIVEESNK